MSLFSEQFRPFAERMRRAGLQDIEIETFEGYYRRLVEGETGMIPESDIEPVESLPDAETLSPDLAEAGRAALAKTILLKLNGGLGTSMGLERAKSLLRVKNNLSFLDIIALQAQQADIPLMLMNSAHTQTDSLAALAKYPELHRKGIPLSFEQSEFPKVRRADLAPVEWPREPALEWYPPGHGNIYLALLLNNLPEKLIEAGYEYAFVSNSDNLGAVIDRTILGYFASNGYPFMMEVADRTEADKKGGHLARQKDRLILRESAQCPEDDMGSFQDINRHKYFNTNNIWLNLRALQELAKEGVENVTMLPLIRNSKTVDPRDKNSTPIYQLETAMGAAIAVFEGAQAIRAPRSRFAPVKTTNDLLAVRSDAFRLTEDYHIVPDPGEVVVELDPAYYKLIDALEARFPAGAPSLRGCAHLKVTGDVKFGPELVFKGEVRLINESDRQVELETDGPIEGERRW